MHIPLDVRNFKIEMYVGFFQSNSCVSSEVCAGKTTLITIISGWNMWNLPFASWIRVVSNKICRCLYILSLNWWFLEGWFMIFLAKRSIKYFIRWAIVAVSLQMSCVGLIHFIQIYWWVEWKLHADMILHGPFTETTTGRDFRKHEPSFDEICSRVRERSRWVFFCA